MTRFTKSMSDMAYDFDEAQKNEGRGGRRQDAPPGRYQMEIKEAFVAASGNGKLKGRPHGVFQMEIAAGRLSGTPHRKLQLLDTRSTKDNRPVGLSILLADLEIMGIKPDTIDDLEDAMGDAVGCIVEVQVVRNGQYTNSYINNLIQGGGQETADDADLEEEEEETEEAEAAPRKRGRPKGSKNKATAAAAPTKKAKKKKAVEENEEDFDEDIFD